ncbi:tRNA (uridine(34)/cytosine(34)/5-carboxymethylaminomethyluridine(34)-2'-O)-methyltransferase TrmL [Salicibibacter kimchii]|uniref:Putative tRNA (cytidine(34)-2'-O)-methyltransferase n=1 Tax=Salicibibacter kimchii TaxID=2099786 RepID=A0A345C378_9BACI|nr:tRNA (uridine(34)/cytosine(34)/5-carboxymethylaminomethyluridine(34)-2'-O)-methyltransferase TrmL [Salicibibacter kimchii]AXF57659.1 tRNA (uridine(34)/cytosine(34)/5-carboxymethylaminomethyluridine(34)-2'-O)-methyltransferase TrmL [Salicibibacter kimchii]
MSLHIVLHEPDIPANTGNIARTCAGTGVFLHLIHPLGFSTEDRMLKRAGCDYWPHVLITHHDSLDTFLADKKKENLYFVETTGSAPYSSFDYRELTQDYYFIFGKETQGLPENITSKYPERCIRLPQNDQIRSLNLSNAVAIVIYEALRQQSFPSLH